jgi:hypothetical protein
LNAIKALFGCNAHARDESLPTSANLVFALRDAVECRVHLPGFEKNCFRLLDTLGAPN